MPVEQPPELADQVRLPAAGSVIETRVPHEDRIREIIREEIEAHHKATTIGRVFGF